MAELTGGVAQPEPSVGDAFGWVARDPEWIGKTLLMGLIGLIPIVGGLQLTGWMLAMLDNLRAGRQKIPPAGFVTAPAAVGPWLRGLTVGRFFLSLSVGSSPGLAFGVPSPAHG